MVGDIFQRRSFLLQVACNLVLDSFYIVIQLISN